MTKSHFSRGNDPEEALSKLQGSPGVDFSLVLPNLVFFSSHMGFFFFLIYLFVYSFIFGCLGSFAAAHRRFSN